jgi:hypothetical protein
MLQRGLQAGVIGLALGAFAAGAVAAAEPVAASRVDLAYEIYSGGFHVLSLDLDLGVGAAGYDVTAKYRTTGVVGWLFPWKSVARSEGAVGPHGMEPRHHRTVGEFRGRTRTVEIDYHDGEVAAVRLDPAPSDDEERDEVPAALRRGALDPMTAILGMVRVVSDGRTCDGRLPVFDGRRRYDFVVRSKGEQKLAPSSLSSYSGTALRCDFDYEQIAGHWRRRNPDESQRSRIRTGRAWLAPVIPGAPVTPVRVEIDGDWGMTIAHLRSYQRSAAAVVSPIDLSAAARP